ncbi:MAG TPA: hypothetical protein VF092_26045 [Longimicrobium sp.]
MRRLTPLGGAGLVFAVAFFVAGVGRALYGFGVIGGPRAPGDVTVDDSLGIMMAVFGIVIGSLSINLSPEPPSREPPRNAGPVLAEWTLAPDEWRAYNDHGARFMRSRAGYNTLVAATLAGLLPYLLQVPWKISIASGALLGLIACVWTLVDARRWQTRVPRSGAHVVIRHGAVQVDGATRALNGDGSWLTAARLRDDLPVPELELVRRTAWTVQGKTSTIDHRIHVPVARGREAEALQVAEALVRKVPNKGEEAPRALGAHDEKGEDE